MNVTDHARDAAMRRTLRLKDISRPSDRILVAALEAGWQQHVGLRSSDFLSAIERLVGSGCLRHCATVAGAALELTAHGACWLDAGQAASPARAPRLIERLGDEWNTFFVLRRARRRTSGAGAGKPQRRVAKVSAAVAVAAPARTLPAGARRGDSAA